LGWQGQRVACVRGTGRGCGIALDPTASEEGIFPFGGKARGEDKCEYTEQESRDAYSQSARLMPGG
jgi:hypothetical protein